MPLSPGSLLNNGRYRILRQVGDESGMGDVYQAEDIQLNKRIIAIKEMRQQGLAQKELDQAIKLFQQEASILSTLNHPNIPDIYANFEEKNQWYLVMKFIEGESLQKRLDKAANGRLSVKEIIQIGLQLCSALEYLHTRQPQIIFRDLKPANVMITPQGHIYLIDFGIARFFTPGQTKDTANFGTLGYRAPEQYGGIQTEPRSDIYSLGAMLHHLLSGINPANNTPLLWDFKPLPASTPAAFSSLIFQMVRLHLDERPASMAAVKQKLQSIADGRVQGANQASASSTGARVTPTSQPFGPISPLSTSSSLFKPSPQYQAPAPRKRSGKGSFAIVALVICAVIGVSVALLSQKSSPTSNQHNLAYYIGLAQSGKVSIAQQPTGVGYQDTNIYFQIEVSNHDQQQHEIVARFSFLVTHTDTRDNSVNPSFQVTFVTSIDGQVHPFDVAANSTVEENVVWGRGGFDSFSDLRNFKAELLTIDDYPVRDPQDVLKQFAVSISPAQPPLVENSNSGGSTMLCQVEITNNDTTAHIVELTANVDYKYLDTGALQDKNYPSHTLGDYGKTISPGTTLNSFSSDDPTQQSPMVFELVAPPDRIQSVQVSFVLQVMDEGDSKLPLSTTTQNIGSQCTYNK